MPIVIVVDGLDEAEPEAAGSGGRGLPLGLPESLPDGVYVVATSRFGIHRALHAVRNPADWLQIEVEGAENLDDMEAYRFRRHLYYVISAIPVSTPSSNSDGDRYPSAFCIRLRL